jgi:hypothetical protein
MFVGMNYAWRNYAWDFGLPPTSDAGTPWGRRAAWTTTIEDELKEFGVLGLKVLRWFLIGDGTTLGTGDHKPEKDPHRPGQWRFHQVPELSPEFLDDFAQLLLFCERADIQLLPSILDFHFCFPAVPVEGSPIVKCGRIDALIDPHKRQQLLDRVVDPILAVCQRFPKTVYAVEIINEPEWCTDDGLWADEKKAVPLVAMQDFVTEGAKRINRAGFLSTVGFAKHRSMMAWESIALGLTLHQFHYYVDPDAVPQNNMRDFGPCIVGEFPSARWKSWPELGTEQDTRSRLSYLERKGYDGALLWSANREEEKIAEPVVEWSERVKDEVSSYLSRRD